MRNKLAGAFMLVFFLSCGSSKKSLSSLAGGGSAQAGLLDNNTFKLMAVSDDNTYGYTQENPVKVGGSGDSEGPLNERRFLNALLGPGGEKTSYERQGSCCPFKTRNGLMGSGLLDRYEVKYKGLDKQLILYINMYDAGDLKAPKGFTFAQ